MFKKVKRQKSETDEFFDEGNKERFSKFMIEAKMPTFTQEFSIICDYCSQSFNSNDLLETHIYLSHYHQCSICKKSFSLPRFLELHILETHDQLFQLYAKKKNIYECISDGCTFKFQNKQERKIHLEKDHQFSLEYLSKFDFL